MHQSVSSDITDKQQEEAEILSSKLKDSMSRKKACVDFTGAFFAADFFDHNKLRTNTKKSIFRCPKLYSDFQIVDIYCNSHPVYVITCYGISFAKIPVIHTQFEITPEAYLVVELKSRMKEADIKGVIYPDMLDESCIDGKYYKIGFENLKPLDELVEKLRRYSGIKPSIGKHLDSMHLFVPYLDNNIEEEKKKQLIRHILTCETCKKSLIETIDFDEKSKEIKEVKEVREIGEIASEETSKLEDNFTTKLSEKSLEETSLKKGAIDVIYDPRLYKDTNKNAKFNLSIVNDIPDNIKKMAALTLVVVVLLCFLVISATSLTTKKAANDKNQEYSEENQEYGNDENYYDSFNPPTIDKNEGYMTVSKVSWEVSSSVKSESQRNFLQQVGKTIRLNLQNDLLLSNQIAMRKQIKFDIKFLRDGNLDEVIVSQSSGTGSVDDIVRQSVENTLRYMHPPKGAFVGSKNSLTLVIDF